MPGDENSTVITRDGALYVLAKGPRWLLRLSLPAAKEALAK